MKKKYMQPLIGIFRVETQGVIALSGGLNRNGEDLTESSVINEGATDAGLSRGSLWDDDEDY